MKLVKNIEENQKNSDKISEAQAEEAFKTILKWIGEDPNREGLRSTPKRLVKAFKEYFNCFIYNISLIIIKQCSIPRNICKHNYSNLSLNFAVKA